MSLSAFLKGAPEEDESAIQQETSHPERDIATDFVGPHRSLVQISSPEILSLLGVSLSPIVLRLTGHIVTYSGLR